VDEREVDAGVVRRRVEKCSGKSQLKTMMKPPRKRMSLSYIR